MKYSMDVLSQNRPEISRWVDGKDLTGDLFELADDMAHELEGWERALRSYLVFSIVDDIKHFQRSEARRVEQEAARAAARREEAARAAARKAAQEEEEVRNPVKNVPGKPWTFAWNSKVFKEWASTEEGKKWVAAEASRKAQEAEAKEARKAERAQRAEHARQDRQRRYERETEIEAAGGHWAYAMKVFTDFVETTRVEAQLELTKELLGTSFHLGDGTVVTWGSATISNHEQRFELLMKNVSGNMETAKLHVAAIRLLEERQALTLNDVARVAA